MICEDFLSQKAEVLISPKKKKKAIHKLFSKTIFYTNNLNNHPSRLSLLDTFTDTRNVGITFKFSN